MNKVLVVDNFDSFTYNLVHYLEAFNCKVDVLRNDEIAIDDIEHYTKILLSPGPGLPDEAGVLKEIISTYAATKSILGVSLGQQAIAEVFGGRLCNLPTVHHGVAENINITVNDEVLFKGMNSSIKVGRYHSWIVNTDGFPEVLEITSLNRSGTIMSLRHKHFDVKGVQFHPESVLTPNGKLILQNWINS